MQELTDYSVNPPASMDGMIADARPRTILSAAAVEAINFGVGLVDADAIDGVKAPKRNTATVIFDADLITSNVINGTVNGTALSATTYATSHAATMAVIAGKIDALLLTLGITAVSTVGGASNRTITTVAQDANVLFASFVVTAGSSQAGVTHTYTTANKFRGVAVAVQKGLRSDNTAGYSETDSVSIITQGSIFVRVRGGAVTKGQAAYLCLATLGDNGGFTGTSTGNIATTAKFDEAGADDALCRLVLNEP